MHILLYAHNLICTYSYMHILLYAHTLICTYSYMHIILFAHTLICTYSYTHILLYAHTFICTHSYICTLHIHAQYILFKRSFLHILFYAQCTMHMLLNVSTYAMHIMHYYLNKRFFYLPLCTRPSYGPWWRSRKEERSEDENHDARRTRSPGYSLWVHAGTLLSPPGHSVWDCLSIFAIQPQKLLRWGVIWGSQGEGWRYPAYEILRTLQGWGCMPPAKKYQR